MVETTPTEHTVWDCRWSRLGYELGRGKDTEGKQHRESPWLCVRVPNAHRRVTDDECRTCPFWKAALEG